MLIHRHIIIGTEDRGRYVNGAGHLIQRYAVIYDHGLRRAYQQQSGGGAALVREDWVSQEVCDALRRRLRGG